MDQSKKAVHDDGPDEKQDNGQYPPRKVVLPAMAAIWLAFFLVALVRKSMTINAARELTMFFLGSYYNRNSHSDYISRLQ